MHESNCGAFFNGICAGQSPLLARPVGSLAVLLVNISIVLLDINVDDHLVTLYVYHESGQEYNRERELNIDQIVFLEPR
jgi:hypothetical protein